MIRARARDMENFYPRPPRGGRRNTAYQRGMADIFLSTPSARRATFVSKIPAACMSISIHALREEGDRGNRGEERLRRISIHALREEGDKLTSGALVDVRKFLSTPSARRATACRRHHAYSQAISIHALREEGDRAGSVRGMAVNLFLSTPSARRATKAIGGKMPEIPISIHALREEGDSKNRDKISIFKQIIQHSARI